MTINTVEASWQVLKPKWLLLGLQLCLVLLMIGTLKLSPKSLIYPFDLRVCSKQGICFFFFVKLWICTFPLECAGHSKSWSFNLFYYVTSRHSHFEQTNFDPPFVRGWL